MPVYTTNIRLNETLEVSEDNVETAEKVVRDVMHQRLDLMPLVVRVSKPAPPLSPTPPPEAAAEENEKIGDPWARKKPRSRKRPAKKKATSSVPVGAS